MKTLKRVGIGLVILAALIATGLMVWEPLSISESAPPPDGSYEARIVRDEFGVPHIFGKTDPDVAYGVAYAHSEDDFATLQEVTAMTRGRMATLNGAESAPIDYIAALLDVRGTVSRKYDDLPADVRALLDGYASGLNAYAADHPEEVKLAKLFPALCCARPFSSVSTIRSRRWCRISRCRAKAVRACPARQRKSRSIRSARTR